MVRCPPNSARRQVAADSARRAMGQVVVRTVMTCLPQRVEAFPCSHPLAAETTGARAGCGPPGAAFPFGNLPTAAMFRLYKQKSAPRMSKDYSDQGPITWITPPRGRPLRARRGIPRATEMNRGNKGRRGTLGGKRRDGLVFFQRAMVPNGGHGPSGEGRRAFGGNSGPYGRHARHSAPSVGGLRRRSLQYARSFGRRRGIGSGRWC
jgi:hypothetical protein